MRFFSGNNFDLNGASLELTDEELEGEDKSVGSLFRRRGKIPIESWGRFRSVMTSKTGLKTGRFSPKRTYIEVVDLVPPQFSNLLQGGGWYFIVGSGIYPESANPGAPSPGRDIRLKACCLTCC